MNVQEALHLLALHQLSLAASVGGVCNPVLDISPMRGLAANTTIRPPNYYVIFMSGFCDESYSLTS